ncbi:HutD family protein [Peptoniphilus asaccharolyticus]
MKLTKEEFKTTNWSGGETSELLISPTTASVGEKNFDFRISSATCELDSSSFTPYNGFTRYITPLDGDLKMVVNGKEVILKPFEVYKFSGSDEVISYSKVRDFNLIVREDFTNKMYSLDVDGTARIEDRNLIFFYESGMRVNGEEYSKMSAYIGEEAEVTGKGKILVCELYE